MSKKTFWVLIPMIVLVISVGLLVTYFTTRSVESGSTRPGSSDALKSISGYRQWTKVNPVPVKMEARAALDCARPTSPLGAEIHGPANPHYQKYITVFVNEAGRKAMLEEAQPQFPVGSAIVKQKLSSPSSQEPELLTVMIKREKGFNPGNGDWEFMVVDGSATKIDAQGRIESCQACHQAKPKTDYVFRSYLPHEVSRKLKEED